MRVHTAHKGARKRAHSRAREPTYRRSGWTRFTRLQLVAFLIATTAAGLIIATSGDAAYAGTPTSITTMTSGDIVLGNVMGDSATLSALSPRTSPTGTITFSLYLNSDACASTSLVFTNTVSVASFGTFDSADFTPTQAGTYNWLASYVGDNNFN
ncbi:MAG: hypothetical protein ACRDYC_08445, partial [Acidimicrobiales bacterium]